MAYGPEPKHHSVRARVNKASTRAVLHERHRPYIPKLHSRYGPRQKSEKTGRLIRGEVIEWHPDTQSWWNEIHGSPMSGEWHPSDLWGLQRLAILVDQFNWTPNPATHAEIRLAQKDYGLTPLDRRRLEWTIENTEKAQDEGQARRAKATPVQAIPTPDPATDPRLRIV